MPGKRGFGIGYGILMGVVLLQIAWNLHQRQLRTELFQAIWSQNEQQVRQLLQWRVNPNARDSEGRFALLAAIETGNLEIVRTLLAYGADLHRSHALAHAAAQQDVPIIKILFTYGARAEARGPDGEPLLASALSQRDRTEALALLLRRGADPLARNAFGQTPLMQALLLGRRRQSALLAKFLPDPNLADRSGRTLLMYAASAWHCALVQTLLQRGATRDAEDIHGLTALQHTMAHSELDFAYQHPVYQRKNANLRDHLNAYRQIIPMLLPRGNSRRAWRQRRDALHTATLTGHKEIVSALVRQGFDIDTPGWTGQTALVLATAARQPTMVAHLLREGANPKQEQMFGEHEDKQARGAGFSTLGATGCFR